MHDDDVNCDDKDDDDVDNESDDDCDADADAVQVLEHAWIKNRTTVPNQDFDRAPSVVEGVLMVLM